MESSLSQLIPTRARVDAVKKRLQDKLQDAERVHVARLDEIMRVHKVRIWSEKCRHQRKVQAIYAEGRE